MSTQRANVAELYTPIYDEFMLSTYNEETQVCPRIYQQIDDPTKEYKVDDLSALGVWETATEGEDGGYEDPVLGYPKTYTQGKKWKKFQVSFEAVDQDEYALLKKQEEAKSMGRGSRAKIEVDASARLYNGFATASPDGQYLWSNSHPKNREETGTTYDNLLSGAFSHDNLELAETQITNNYFDPAGIPIAPEEDPILLYPSALRGAVARVLKDRANEQPDTTLRNINRFAGRYTPIEWRYLGSAFGGSDTAWYIIYKSMNMLKVIWNARPHFTAWVDEDKEFYKFKGRMLYALGECNWRCGFAATGL